MNTHASHRRIAFVTGGSGFVGTRLVKALIKEGWEVRSLARTVEAQVLLAQLGAVPVIGDLNDDAALRSGFAHVEVVFHVAALFGMWGDQCDFERVNVEGMRSVIAAAITTPSVRRVVGVSAAAVVMGDPEPMIDVDESAPLQHRGFAPYSASKARGEAILTAASNQRPGLQTIALRPPMIWGAGMPMLDHLIQTVEAGKWQWVDDGVQRMSTCHVDNLVAALILAADFGENGQAYFIADEDQKTLKTVITGLLATRHIYPAHKSVSFRTAWRLAGIIEPVWRLLRLKGEPPITRQMLRLIGKSFTISCSKASRELGYVPRTTWNEGIAEMSQPNKCIAK